jgi:1,3-beta-glucan synthase
VIRFAMLYFFMLVVFVALIVGPVVARRFVNIPKGIPMDLLQPTGQNNNDTLGRTQTGTALLGGAAATASSGADAGAGAAPASGDGGGAPAVTSSPFDRARFI